VSAEALWDQRCLVATACRVLGVRGLVDGVLGHVSARVGEDTMLLRCRGRGERGVARTAPEDVRLVGFDGLHREESDGWQVPKEWPIHAGVLTARPDVHAVVHAHPRSVLIAGLAELDLRPVYGAFNIPGMRLALDGVPVYPRPVLISRPELAAEMLEAMGRARVCVLRGHGITVAGATVQQATVTAVNLEELCSVSLELARLGATPPVIGAEDLAELPDLGGAFNDTLAWNALTADVPTDFAVPDVRAGY
jgi:ribulose-5-phosphate 4-epimerase/fuculose-1-phosphate aldolase